MPSSALKDVRSKALELSESDRAELAHDLVASLDGLPDLAVQAEWDVEILQRLRQIEGGKVNSVTRAELGRKMRQHIAAN